MVLDDLWGWVGGVDSQISIRITGVSKNKTQYERLLMSTCKYIEYKVLIMLVKRGKNYKVQ